MNKRTGNAVKVILKCISIQGLTSLIYAQPGPRPYQPWVQKQVVNNAPRTIVVALSSKLWLMYDESYGALRMAWQGGTDPHKLISIAYPGSGTASQSWGGPDKKESFWHIFEPKGQV